MLGWPVRGPDFEMRVDKACNLISRITNWIFPVKTELATEKLLGQPLWILEKYGNFHCFFCNFVDFEQRFHRDALKDSQKCQFDRKFSFASLPAGNLR